jgi:hypothetical protein
MSIAHLVATYIRAKDSNRPHLMKAAFAQDAALEMIVNAGTISFPPRSAGLDAITDVLVSRFGQTFENVHTFCLCTPPEGSASSFSCPWLVGMSEKAGGAVRLGSGRYDWTFRSGRVQHLTITIDQMEVLPPSDLEHVMGWLGSLPYPWCPADVAERSIPPAYKAALHCFST